MEDKVKLISLNIEIDGAEKVIPIENVKAIDVSKNDTLIISVGCLMKSEMSIAIADGLKQQLGCSVVVLDARFNTNIHSIKIGTVKDLNVEKSLKVFIDMNIPPIQESD